MFYSVDKNVILVIVMQVFKYMLNKIINYIFYVLSVNCVSS